jgi:hypothetical protein
MDSWKKKVGITNDTHFVDISINSATKESFDYRANVEDELSI